jgi:hypothetical protein
LAIGTKSMNFTIRKNLATPRTFQLDKHGIDLRVSGRMSRMLKWHFTSYEFSKN